MTFSRATPIRFFAWAILIGVSAFLALFYMSFFAMAEREEELLHLSTQQDSLLLSAFSLVRDIDELDIDRRDAERLVISYKASIDSLLGVHDVELPESIVGSLESFFAAERDHLGAPQSGKHRPLYDRYRDVAYELTGHFSELAKAENDTFRLSVNIWAGISGLIIIIGFGYTMRLAVSESHHSIALNRLSSVFQASEDPVIVYDPEGRTLLTNAAFKERFSASELDGERSTDQFMYMNTTAEGRRSETLWIHMIEELGQRTSWMTDVPYTSSGSTNHFSMYAIRERGEGDRLSEIVVIHTDVTEYQGLHAKAKEALEQYRSVVENSPDALVLLQDGKVVYANESAILLFGLRHEERVSEQRFEDLFGSAGKLAFHVAMDGRTVGEQILQNAEFRASTKQGKMIDVEASASIVRWGDDLALQAAFRDITERKMLEREQALWSWEQDALSEIDRRLVGIVDLQIILDSIVQQVLKLSRSHWAGILMPEQSDRFVRWRSMGGRTKSDTDPGQFELTPTIRAIFSGTDPLVVQELQDHQRETMSSLPGLLNEGIISSVWLPLRVEERQEGVLAVGYRSYHAFEGREMRLLKSLAEKTAIALANARLYENLLEREKELEILSGARIDAQEEERRRIAREIHDGLGQILTAIKLNVEIIEDSPGLGGEDRKKFEDVKELLDSVMKEAREISYNLMPSVLDDFGLTPALQLLTERFGAQSRVHVQFFGKDDPKRHDHRMEVALYRIVQEALTNSVRHGEAEHVTVQLTVSGDSLRLTIEDDGKGMDESMPRIRRAQGGGIGLASMRERVNSFNGSLEIDSAPGKGTVIVVELPVEPTSENSTS